MRALNLTRTLTGAGLAATGENVLYATSDLVKTDGSRLAVGDVMLAFGDLPAAASDDGAVGGGHRPNRFDQDYASPDQRPETLDQGAVAAAPAAGGGSDDGLDSADRTAASAKPSKSKSAAGGETVQRPGADPLPTSPAAEPPAALAPRSWSQIDLAGILDAATAPSSGLMAVDYDAMLAGPSPSALDDNLALAQQTRLRMIQAMAGFAREGAADLGPDAWRQGHAQSLALLTALPDVRGR